MLTLTGTLLPIPEARFAIVAAKFNDFIVSQLVAGARNAFAQHGVGDDQLTLVEVPGAWEMPAIATRLARTGRFDAIVALGAVIRGGTPHFDYVAGAAANGLSRTTADTGVPVAFGVLTTDTIEQAIERAGTKAGNKGADAALAALEMVSLDRKLKEQQL